MSLHVTYMHHNFVCNLRWVFSKFSFRWHSAYLHSALYPSFRRKKSALNFPQIAPFRSSTADTCLLWQLMGTVRAFGQFDGPLLGVQYDLVYSIQPVRPVWLVHVHTLADAAAAWFIRTPKTCRYRRRNSTNDCWCQHFCPIICGVCWR